MTAEQEKLFGIDKMTLLAQELQAITHRGLFRQGSDREP